MPKTTTEGYAMLKRIALGTLAAGMSLGVALPAHAETAGTAGVAGVTGVAAANAANAASPVTAAMSGPTDLPGIGALVDGIVNQQLAHDKIPGAAVVVVAGGKTVYTQGYGVSNVGKKTPVSADQTEFFTGSVAKLFTATAALQLAQQGKLDLHADVNRYLTTFKVRDSYPGRPVTLEDLLTHTAGFDDDPVGAAVTDPADVPQLGKYLTDHQPDRVRPPGTVAAYDNYGVALAGYLVEVASGEPFAQYVQEHVLSPLGMASTTFAQPHPAALEAALAHGYRPDGSGQTTEHGQYGAWSPTGAGTVSTVADMGRFLSAQLADDPRLGDGVAALMQQQHFTEDPRLPGLGYLFEQRPRNGQQLLFKDGDVPGFHSNLAILPQQGVGIYVVYNGDGDGGVANWDGKDLINRVVDRYLPAVSAAAPVRVAGASGDRYAGNYRLNRTSHSALTKAAALTGSATVSVSSDGTLTTSGLSQNPNAADQHWVPIGPGLYQERDGQDRIAFDGKGRLFATMDPTVAYDKLAWYDSPTLHQIMLYSGAGVLMAAFSVLPVVALLRRLRGKEAHPRLARAALALAWITAGLASAFTVGFMMLASDSNALSEAVVLGSGSLTALLLLNTLTTVTTVGLVAGTAEAWRRGWWGFKGRLGYTAVTAASISFLTVVYVYNLAAWHW